MKKNIFMYLFLFTALFVLFQFMNAKKAKESYDAKIEKLQFQLKSQDSLAAIKIDSLVDINLDLTYFSLESNEDAASYFEEMGYNPNKLALTISDKIIGENAPGKDNPIVPYAGMEGHMAINKVRLLNHKWIIADFTDGVYWGELFITYEVREDGVVDFEVERSFLYPRN
ncbi:hypothetical protein J8281_11070 [Aquimarina sp. U1-2]|uniref:hypothetical protein n=1 Tax=Aquimarina sp. U1-2 TaxID=2823141 RepID=UPI001AEC9DE9|nr:hypothetical protein [Aquimarina sp. U1-2]MBP2832727.1 hypothetical protein [Aquimarina sp. U1-2]